VETVTHDLGSDVNDGLGWRARAERASRSLAAISVAGALAGVLVGGVGGRLAMMLLARLNPRATGVTSDDGFIIGRFTVTNTLSLLAVGFGLGLFGAALYAVLRGLMIGPRWFQVLSISGGPAVVVGEMLVHTDGVDFTLLEPAGLAIALFVLIPGAYAVLLTLLAERWIRADGWFMRAPLRYVIPTLLVWAVGFFLLPVLAVLVSLWVVREVVRRTPVGAAALSHPAGPWLVRAALAVLFITSTVELLSETAQLT
jgi:hypothetical protein